MSFVEKRFCFTCKLDTEQLKKKNKKLKTCSFCQIAQYCGQECQRLDFKLTHKLLCIKVGNYGVIKEGCNRSCDLQWTQLRPLQFGICSEDIKIVRRFLMEFRSIWRLNYIYSYLAQLI